MATSGSYNFSVSRNDICYASLRVVGALASGETPEASELTEAIQALNMMVKSWQGSGLEVWAAKRATLFLQLNQSEYALGPSGDHATHSYVETAIRVAGIATDTTIEVDSTTGMTVADNVGIVLDSGSIHWTTIATIPDADTITIATGLPSGVAVDKAVYAYTSKIPRPVRIIQAFTRNTSDQDYTVYPWHRDEHWSMYDKTLISPPTRYFYEAHIPNGTLYTNYRPLDVTETLELVYHRPFEDFDAAGDEPDFPQEWFEALKYGLALRLAPEYGRMSQDLVMLAEASKANAEAAYRDQPRAVIPTAF
jgi:hypothetical protein